MGKTNMSVPKSHFKLFWPSFFITPHFNDTQQIRCATFCYLLTASEILLHRVDSSAHSTKNDVRLASFIPHPSLGHCVDSSPMSTKDLSDSLAIIPHPLQPPRSAIQMTGRHPLCLIKFSSLSLSSWQIIIFFQLLWAQRYLNAASTLGC